MASTEKDSGADHIDVSYVAQLARLDLTAEEVTMFEEQLDQVLAYVSQIGELDVEGVEPTAHAIAVRNVFRPDQPRPGLDRGDVLSNAPAHDDDQFQVPAILE